MKYFKKESPSMEQIETLLNFLAEGDVSAVLENRPSTEEGSLERKIWNISKMLSDYVDILNGLTEGDFRQRVPMVNGKNQLGSAINKVVDSITNTSTLATEVKRALEEERNKLIQEDWVKSQYASIFEKIQGVKAISDLGEIVLSEIAFSVQAQMGMFFVKQNHSKLGEYEGEFPLKLVASYGVYTKEKKEGFHFGEGIIGQCVLDMKPRYFENVPDNFIQIESGMGRKTPGSVVVMPIVYEGELYGVFELASLERLSEIQKRLIEQMAKSIGITIKSITGNMLTEKLLKEIAEKNSSLASQKQALDSSAIVAETDARGRITYLNDKFLEISKYGREELLGQDHRILNSHYHPKEFFIGLWKTIAKGEVWHGEVRNRAKDGSFYWVDTTIYPVKDENGRPQKYVAIRFDITDKKRALEELQLATEQARKAAAIKTEFLANMSHEIRTPMNAIIGMGDLLKETPLNVDQERHVNVLTNAGSALLDVINNILDLSKIESGQMQLENIPYDIEDVIHATLDIMGGIAHKKRLELVASIHPEVKSLMTGDPSRLRQVLINLVGNAIKFTESGEVVLRVENDRASADFLSFSVMDTGVGIPKDKFEKIFGSFSQANTSTSREYGGTGLGLAISKKIIESMGGKIGFESVEGKGSRFYFSIPKRDRGEKSVAAPEFAQMKGLRALVVDGSHTNRAALAEMLTSWSMFSDQATDGLSALEMAKQAFRNGNPYQMILIGYHLSDKNGLEVLRDICKITKEPPIGIVMLSSDDKRNELRRTRGLGITSYMVKPIRRQELLQTTLSSVHKYQNKPIVLVTDDDKDMREEIVNVVRSLGVQVLEAENGQKALELLKANPVKVVLTDIKMPVMDGITLFEETRKSGLTMPFVFISGHMNTVALSASTNAENVNFLEKPFHLNALLDLVSEHLDRAVAESLKKTEERSITTSPVKNLKILLVDDVKENLDLVQIYLRKYPYQVDVAMSGQECLDKFMASKYDLIFMDIQMPVMDGHEAIRKIRKMEELQGLRPTTIVTLSAHALSEEMENSMNAGSDGYLTKPIKKKVLLEAIDRYGVRREKPEIDKARAA